MGVKVRGRSLRLSFAALSARFTLAAVFFATASAQLFLCRRFQGRLHLTAARRDTEPTGARRHLDIVGLGHSPAWEFPEPACIDDGQANQVRRYTYPQSSCLSEITHHNDSNKAPLTGREHQWSHATDSIKVSTAMSSDCLR